MVGEPNLNLRSVHDVLTDREDNSDPTNQNDPSPYTTHNTRLKRNQDGSVNVPRRKFFYDAQIARLIIQIGAKCFGGYQVMTGYQADGKTRMMDVPVLYGSLSRVASQLLGPATENVIPRLPAMSYTITSIRRKDAEMRNQQFTDQHVVRYRERDPDGNLLVNQPGKLIVVERLMPVPYDVDIDLAIWSPNNDQQNQLIEQLLAEFTPDMEIMLSNSPFNWTSPTRIIFRGETQMEEVIQANNPDPQMICRMQFTTTLRVSLPVKVYDATLIHEIDVKIHDLEDFGYFYFGENIEIPDMPILNNLVLKASEQEIIDHGDQ
jgi:hypothetical protein